MSSSCLTIGLCLTRLGDEANSLLVKNLRKKCVEAGARLIVFNSLRDFYRGDEYDRGASIVYDLVEPRLLDALVIVDEGFFDKDTIRKLINCMQEQHKPVITLYGAYKGCFSILKHYDTVFASLIRHVITEHHAQKLRLIAGNQSSEHTQNRERIFREVMSSSGLPLTADSVSYCDDWDGPVIETVERWCTENDLPEAVICASDVMARAALDTLTAHGIRVPEDIIVTGFDGLPSVRYDYPDLTTCDQDQEGTATRIMRMISEAVRQRMTPYTAMERYQMRLAASCGCTEHARTDDHAMSRYFHASLETELYRMEETYNWADHILAAKTVDDFHRQLCRSLPGSSMLALFEDEGNKRDNADSFFPLNENKAQQNFPVVRLHPQLDEACGPGEVLVVQSIHVGEAPIGYLTMRFGDEKVRRDAQTMSRAGRTLNLVFASLSLRSKHDRIANRLNQMRLEDTMTGLMNLNGLSAYVNKQYAELSKKSIGASVYEITLLNNIRNEFGIEAADRMAENTAKMLQQVNPGDYVARISGKTFVVLNFA